MKKLITIILMATMSLALITGCSSTDSDSEQNTANNEQATEQETETDEDNTLVMFTNAEFAPFEYFEGENIVGVDVDIATEIAKDLGKELKVEHIDFSSIVPAVINDKADIGAAGMTITPARMEEVDFSIPYVESIQHIIYKNGAEIKSMEDLKGKKIGVQLGTTGDLAISSAISEGDLKDSGAETKTYKNALEASQDLLLGRIDAVVIDKLTAEQIVKNNNEELGTVIFGDISESYGICVKKGNKELLDSINKTLERLISEGKIEEFIKNHSK